MLSLAATIDWGNDGPNLDGAWGLGDEIGAALTRGESGVGYTIFNVQRLWIHQGMRLQRELQKRKSLLFNSKVFHAKTQR